MHRETVGSIGFFTACAGVVVHGTFQEAGEAIVSVGMILIALYIFNPFNFD